MNSASNLWGREPAMILSAVSAVVSLAVGFGLDLTTEQMGLIVAAVSTVIGVVTRQRVTPV